MRTLVLLQKDGKLILSSLIRFLIGVGIQFLLVAPILFQYFVVLCRIALGLHLLTSLKSSILVCLKFWEWQISLINYETVLKAKKDTLTRGLRSNYSFFELLIKYLC